MNRSAETKSFGSIRKYKQAGTCGVILGLAALSLAFTGGTVSADERVNPNPATNAQSLQESPTVESTKDQGSTGKSTGSVEVTVGRDKVESAVSAAKEAGLTVKEKEVDGGLVANPDELAKKTAEIESSYDKQASTVVDESKKYKEEVANRKEEIKTITTENKEKQDSYDKAKAQYDKDLSDATTKNAQIDKENREKNERLKAEKERVAKENERIKQENALAKTMYEKALADKAKKDADIDKENAAAKKKYESELNTWTIEKGKYDADLTKYNEELEKYKKALAEAKRRNEEIAKKNLSDKEAYAKAVEARKKENEAILKANKEALDAYEKALAELKRKNEQVDKDNGIATSEYNDAMRDYQKRFAQYKEDLAEYNRKLAEYNKQNLKAQGGGVKIVGEFDESKRGSLDYYSKLTAVFDEDKTLEVVSGALGANANTTMTLDTNLTRDTSFSSSEDPSKWGGMNIRDIQQGSKFTLHNVGRTATGKIISATFTSRSTPVPEHRVNGNKDVYTSMWVWWNKVSGGSVSEVGFYPRNYLNVEWDISFFDETTKKPLNLGVINIYSDLDYAQAIRYTYGDNNTGAIVNPLGSKVKEVTTRGLTYWAGVKTDGVHDSDDSSPLNRWKAGDPWYTNVGDVSATPEGSLISVGKGTTHHLTYLARYNWNLVPYTEAQSLAYKKYVQDNDRAEGKAISTDKDIFETGYAFQLWGGKSVIDKIVPPIEPEQPNPPKLTQKDKETLEKPTPKPLLPDVPPTPADGDVPLPKEPPKPGEFLKKKPNEPNYKEKDKTPIAPPVAKPLVLPPKDVPDTPHVPTPNEPPKPELRTVPNEVTPREVEVTYTRLRTTPTVEKLVKNSGGINVNNSSVPKLSEVVWELETKPLAANRKETTIYELTDNLPQGYHLDLAKTIAQNSDFTVTYNKAKHQLKGVLKSEGLAKVNADLTKAYTVSVLKIYGTVTNDAATYKNNFRLNLNNEFESYSNVVKVTTPGDPHRPGDSEIKPVKVNYNKDGVKINDKQVLPGSINYYHVLLDYDQYIGIKSGKDAIQKGFGAIEVYPSEAVDLMPSEIRYVDSNGKEVKGISAYHFNSVSEVKDARILSILNTSNIKPKGAFQVFMADDPQSYFDNYVSKGISVTVIDPMKVKESLGKTGGSYENKAYQVDFGNGYEADVVKNKVPSPKPTKQNLNEQGEDINNKPVLAGTVNYYTVKADYRDYKGIEADKETIKRGFYIVDDYPEDKVTINEKDVVVTDSKGNKVTGLTAHIYNSVSDAPKGVQDALAKQGFKPKGVIQVFSATNPEEYYAKYVQTGDVVTIKNPMTLKKEFLGKVGEYENTAYQLDFGLAKVTETVKNNFVKPTPKKANFNKDGVNIDGKEVLAGSINYYHVTADYSSYKGIKADKSRIAQGFFIADDYPEDVLEVLSEGIKLVDSKGQEVKGLKYAIYESVEKAPEVVRNALITRGFNPKGAFQVWEAENQEEYYAKYVQTGDKVMIINPMKVKEQFAKTGGKYENTAYQIDFGVADVTVTVVNNIPKLETKKDVIIKIGDTDSQDGKTLVLGQTFYYSFAGSLIPGNRADDLFEYKFVDDYQETHDRFDGVYKVIAKRDFVTIDGKHFKAGDDLTAYSWLKEDKAKGQLEVGLKEDFLRSITKESEFQADVFVEMTRIQAGEVENTESHVVNGVTVSSNTVKTRTELPPTPTTPTPQQPVLPNTGAETTSAVAVAGYGLLALASLSLSTRKRKEED
jgi:adhesin isopeptide-forming family sspB-C2 type protein/LPXTG-motif cell wall-anchored protein